MSKHKANGWPSMFYHPVTAAYIKCENADEVPEGFLSDPNECSNRPEGELKKWDGKDAPKPVKSQASKDPKKVKKEVEVEDEEDDEEDDEIVAVTLKDLKIDRKQAIQILKEEGVDFGKSPKNDHLAFLVNELLEKEKAEEDADSE